MPIIDEIRIENFRSIRDLKLKGLNDYSPVIGLNSAGKSNLLRALKLFFTGSVDEAGSPLSMARDYSDFSPKKGRRVVVGLVFDLGGDLKYPRQSAFLKKHDLEDSLAIQQTWSIDSQTRSLSRKYAFGPDLDHLSSAVDPSELANIEAFVRAIEFRYIPNHARPSELIEQYVAPLRGALVSRLQNTREYKSSDVAELLGAMSRLSDTLFADVSTAIGRGLQGRTLKSDVPSDFADLAFDLAVRSVDSSGRARDPELEGSGAQQFMFLHLLDLADRTARAAGFGWLQGHVWAVEEPESFLHMGLRQRFAADLLAHSTDSRRQVFLTTHQDEFVRVGDRAIVARAADAGTTFDPMSSREALVASTKAAITNYRHPLLQFPDQPLVLVEGKFDALYLQAAVRHLGLRPRWRVVDPDDLTGSATGGDAFKQYLKYNTSAIASRPDAAPIVVLRDWETNDCGTYSKFLSDHPYSKAIVMPEELCNDGLGPTWRGIERYLTVEYVREIVRPGDLLSRADGILELGPDNRTTNKQALARKFDLQSRDAPELLALTRWLDAEVEDVMNAIPSEAFI